MLQLSRRQLASAAVGLGIGGCTAESELLRGDVIVSAQGAEDRTFALSGAAEDGAVLSVATGFRGHGLAVHPARAGVVAMAARRPGLELALVDVATSQVVTRVEAAAGTHFFGHGVFSPRGDRLYTTEADIEAGQGRIGVRDGDTLALIEHFPSHGVGPHELGLLPDGETLVVANGGILTRPESGRDKLNLDTMDPNLSYIDRRSGRLLERCRLGESKASIRHLAVASDGTVAVGIQLQREALSHSEPVPLGARHRRGEEMTYLSADLAVWWSFEDYVGSVAINELHDVVALTSPRGDVVGFWQLSNGRYLDRVQMTDVSGVVSTPDAGFFACSNSLGDMRFIDAASLVEDKGRRRSHPDLRWDNHLSAVTVT